MVSGVAAALLATTKSVRARLSRCSVCFTAAGSVESRRTRSGKPILEPKMRLNTSAARAAPPMPRRTTWLNCRRRISSAKLLRSSVWPFMIVGEVSQPRRWRMVGTSPLHSVASFTQRRSRKSCSSRMSIISCTAGSLGTSSMVRGGAAVAAVYVSSMPTMPSAPGSTTIVVTRTSSSGRASGSAVMGAATGRLAWTMGAGAGAAMSVGPGREGARVGAAAGRAAGGDATGGGAAGGDATGGDATGGDATGGDATGGDATGGDATGGDATGGGAVGWETTVGDARGGDATKGEATGGGSAGGETTGRGATGGEVTGGDATGGNVTGSEASGGE